MIPFLYGQRWALNTGVFLESLSWKFVFFVISGSQSVGYSFEAEFITEVVLFKRRTSFLLLKIFLVDFRH